MLLYNKIILKVFFMKILLCFEICLIIIYYCYSLIKILIFQEKFKKKMFFDYLNKNQKDSIKSHQFLN